MAKKKTGTREWAESSFNIGVGCAHDCKYCYARSMSKRAGTIKSDAEWTVEKLKTKMPAIMFPTTHDITPFYLLYALDALVSLLAKGNKVLIVSKPHLECVARMCDVLSPWKKQILFRFTIGTSNNLTAEFWEPGAPKIEERLSCLQYAFEEGFATSVSMEPMLGNVFETLDMFNLMAPHVTDKIWIGKMNKIDGRVVKVDHRTAQECDRIVALQSDENIMWLVNQLANHPKIAWKDSIKEVIAKYED